MGAAKHNISIEQGITFELNLSFQSSGSVPIDLTGRTLTSQLRTNFGDSKVLAEMRITGSLDASGSFGIFLNPTDTLAITVGNHVWDLVTSTSESATRWLEGNAIVRPVVSK